MMLLANEVNNPKEPIKSTTTIITIITHTTICVVSRVKIKMFMDK